jgi:hypothetical protein
MPAWRLVRVHHAGTTARFFLGHEVLVLVRRKDEELCAPQAGPVSADQFDPAAVVTGRLAAVVEAWEGFARGE